jgi:hypothetical protein
VAEIPLDGTPHGDFNENEHDHDHEDGYGYDTESGSNSSQRGIWQTREVIVESFQETNNNEDGRGRGILFPRI